MVTIKLGKAYLLAFVLVVGLGYVFAVGIDSTKGSHLASQILLNSGDNLQYAIDQGAIGGSAWTDGGGFIHYDDGNVGIGTGATAPSTKLDVNGIIRGMKYEDDDPTYYIDMNVGGRFKNLTVDDPIVGSVTGSAGSVPWTGVTGVPSDLDYCGGGDCAGSLHIPVSEGLETTIVASGTNPDGTGRTLQLHSNGAEIQLWPGDGGKARVEGDLDVSGRVDFQSGLGDIRVQNIRTGTLIVNAGGGMFLPKKSSAGGLCNSVTLGAVYFDTHYCQDPNIFGGCTNGVRQFPCVCVELQGTDDYHWKPMHDFGKIDCDAPGWD